MKRTKINGKVKRSKDMLQGSDKPFNSYLRNKKIHYLLIGIIAFALYARMIGFGFIGLDDRLFIIENRAFIQDMGNVVQAFKQDVFQIPNHPGSDAYYRPLFIISFMIDAQISKTEPWMYHLTNVILHMLASVLLVHFLTLMRIEPMTVLFLALVYTVHPILAQAVGWIPGRNDIMLTIFILLCFISFTMYRNTGKLNHLFLHIFSFILAMFTKELTLFLPVLIFYYVFIICKESFVSKKYLVIIPVYFLVGLVWFVLRKAALSEHNVNLSFAALFSHIINNYPLLIQYLTKIIIPWKLSPVSTVEDTNYFFGALALLFLLGGIIISRNKDWKITGFGFLWYLLFMLPSLAVPKMTGFEHRVYLPLIGLLLVLSEIDIIKKLYKKNLTIFLATMLILILVIINVRYASTFSDKFNFWETAAENSAHSSMACLNYGAALVEQERLDEAVKVYKRGINVNPYERMIHNNLAIIYARKKMFEEAEKEFLQEIYYNPNYSDAYYNLGILYNSLGKYSDAIQMWEKTLEINPGHQRAGRSLGSLQKNMSSDMK